MEISVTVLKEMKNTEALDSTNIHLATAIYIPSAVMRDTWCN